jgi:hypothetical protein
VESSRSTSGGHGAQQGAGSWALLDRHTSDGSCSKQASGDGMLLEDAVGVHRNVRAAGRSLEEQTRVHKTLKLCDSNAPSFDPAVTCGASATWQQAPAAVQGSNSTAHGQTAGSDQTAGGWREMHASTAAEEGSGRPGPDAPLIQLLRYSMTHNTLHHPTTPSITLTPVESPTSFHGQI